MEKTYKVLSWVNVVGLAIVLGVLLQPQGLNLGAQSNFSGPVNSLAGYQESGTEIINTNGDFLDAVSSTANINAGSFQLDGGAQLGELNCATSSWNPGSVASSGNVFFATSTEIALAGSASGDPCFAGLTSATGTSEIALGCYVSGASGTTSTLILTNLSGAAVDLATGTARACYFGF